MSVLDSMAQLHDAEVKEDTITVLEESPVGDSAGNGFAERAVQQVEDIVRVHKLALECKVKERLSVDSCPMSWLVQNAVDVVNECLIRVDCMSAYEKMEGRICHANVLICATPKMHRVGGKMYGGVLSERWYGGFLVGEVCPYW